MPTAQVSLIREQTAAIKPPRALWVPFMLGRPFGAPRRPELQRAVLTALLHLFERESGPVLEDFSADAFDLQQEEPETAFACPVSFARAVADENDVAAALQREIAQLKPWHELAVKRRGRTSFGISGMTIEDAASHASSYSSREPEDAPAPGSSRGAALKRACDDIKTYYFEAVAAQPGNLSAQAIDRWFWHETTAAKLFFAIQQVCRRSADKSLKPLGENSLVPRAIYYTLVEKRSP